MSPSLHSTPKITPCVARFRLALRRFKPTQVVGSCGFNPFFHNAFLECPHFPYPYSFTRHHWSILDEIPPVPPSSPVRTEKTVVPRAEVLVRTRATLRTAGANYIFVQLSPV